MESGTDKSQSKAMSERAVFRTVLIHCIIIILSPITTFFILKIYVFDELLKLESMKSNLYSAFSAVIVLHVALGNFIYKAYFQSQGDSSLLDKFDKED